MQPERILVIGGGHAGGVAATALRDAGHRGPLTIIGEEPVPPYERPPLSKDVLTGRMAPEAVHLCPPERWAALDVGLRLGVRAVSIDRAARRVLLSDGASLDYDALVIATGVRPRRLGVPGADHPRVHMLRTLADADRLRRNLAPGSRLVAIGAGFIGLEVAASARALGAEVTVIELAPRPLARLLPGHFADWLAAQHRASSVEIRCGCAVTAIRDADGGIAIALSDGAEIAADLAVIGIGSVPNVELAHEAGLAVRDGIVVDADCRTADPSIFAIGDVARVVDAASGIDRRLESWRNAIDQATRVAATITGGPAPEREAPWFWTDQYGRNIQIAGLPDETLTLVERGLPDEPGYLAFYLGGPVIRAAIGVDCGRDMRIARRLIQAGTPVDPARLADRSARLPRA